MAFANEFLTDVLGENILTILLVKISQDAFIQQIWRYDCIWSAYRDEKVTVVKLPPDYKFLRDHRV